MIKSLNSTWRIGFCLKQQPSEESGRYGKVARPRKYRACHVTVSHKGPRRPNVWYQCQSLRTFPSKESKNEPCLWILNHGSSQAPHLAHLAHSMVRHVTPVTHYTTLRYATLHYTTLHYTTLHMTCCCSSDFGGASWGVHCNPHAQQVGTRQHRSITKAQWCKGIEESK